MKFMSLILALLVALPGFAGGPIVAGTETDNGGDPCEIEMFEILLNLQSWIEADKHLDLELPEDWTHQKYKVEMLFAAQQIFKTGISFVSEKLFVGETEKTCLNRGQSIRCNLERISRLSREELYILYHHEIAGVAKLEVNDGEISDYTVSQKISGKLKDMVVKKLPIDPMGGGVMDDYRRRKLENIAIQNTKTLLKFLEVVQDQITSDGYSPTGNPEVVYRYRNAESEMISYAAYRTLEGPVCLVPFGYRSSTFCE